MNKDPYDLTPVPKKDIFTYTDMTVEDFKNLVDNLFDKHAKKIGDHWVYEDGLDFLAAFGFACDLRAVLAAANGPLQATTSKPLPVIPWSGSNLTEMEELLQKVQQLETENAALREDKARLDWIAMRKSTQLVYFAVAGWAITKASGGDVLHDCNIHDLRAAIDAACAKEAKP